jgi:hypothetical protein
MTIPVVPEICAAARIIRPEPLHAVSERVTRRRTVRHRRRRTIVARPVGRGQRSAYDCPRDNRIEAFESDTSSKELDDLRAFRLAYNDASLLEGGDQ